MIKKFKKLGIVVIDVCDPTKHSRYHDESEINDAFVKFLNIRLKDLKTKRAKIIEVNYPSFRHPLLDVEFDFSTVDADEFRKYICENKIEHLIYCGFHYGVCIHRERELSSYNVAKWKIARVSISPFLSRPLESTYGTIITNDPDNLVFDILL